VGSALLTEEGVVGPKPAQLVCDETLRSPVSLGDEVRRRRLGLHVLGASAGVGDQDLCSPFRDLEAGAVKLFHKSGRDASSGSHGHSLALAGLLAPLGFAPRHTGRENGRVHASARRCWAPVWGLAALAGLVSALAIEAWPEVPAWASPLQVEEHGGTYHDGGVLAYGSARFLGSPVGTTLAAPVVAMAAAPDGLGYWLASADGGVYAFGDAGYYGNATSSHPYAPIVAMAATPDGRGYWLVGANGAVYSFGDARYFGSPAASGGVPDPVVGFATTPDGGGYWLVTSHGAVYSFGDAHYYGSLGRANLHNIPVVAIAPAANGRGYWLVQGGGEVVPYGDAPRLGGMRGHAPVAGIAVAPGGQGYWLVCNDGQVEAFGKVKRLGEDNHANPRPPISAIVADPAGMGYWLLDPAAFKVGFTRPSTGTGTGARVVALAATQLGPSPDGGGYCNPYGPCEQWCSLFATWAWEAAGIPVPRYAFVGSVYYWARRHTRVLAANAKPAPGDLVLYGTGPQSVRASPHIGVVAQVWPDGAIDTIEGDAGPGVHGWTAVLVNGPFLPAQSFFANGFAVYGFAVP